MCFAFHRLSCADAAVSPPAPLKCWADGGEKVWSPLLPADLLAPQSPRHHALGLFKQFLPVAITIVRRSSEEERGRSVLILPLRNSRWISKPEVKLTVYHVRTQYTWAYTNQASVSGGLKKGTNYLWAYNDFWSLNGVFSLSNKASSHDWCRRNANYKRFHECEGFILHFYSHTLLSGTQFFVVIIINSAGQHFQTCI